MSVPAASRATPVLGWVRGSERSALRPDVLGGLTVAAVERERAEQMLYDLSHAVERYRARDAA